MFLEQQISILEWFLKDHMTLKECRINCKYLSNFQHNLNNLSLKSISSGKGDSLIWFVQYMSNVTCKKKLVIEEIVYCLIHNGSFMISISAVLRILWLCKHDHDLEHQSHLESVLEFYAILMHVT